MKQQPKPTTGAVVYHPEKGQDIILLTMRNVEPFKGYWCLAGGHIEQFETSVEAAIREVKEETGLDLSEPQYLTYFDEIFPEMDIHNVVQMFYGKGRGRPEAEPGEVSEMKWFSVKEALEQNLAFKHKQVIQTYAERTSIL